VEGSLTRTAAAFSAALFIHILFLRMHPQWRLADIPWSAPGPPGITVRIASSPVANEPQDMGIESDPANAAVSRTKSVPQPEPAPITAESGQREEEVRPTIIKPEQAIKRLPDVFAPQEATDRSASQILDAVAAPPAASSLLPEKITTLLQGKSVSGGQQDTPAAQRPSATGSVHGGSIVRTAIPLYQRNPPPVYPALARKRGYEGTTILRVLVNETGAVDTVRVATSSGHELLDRAAMQAVAGWSFAPATRNGRSVTMWVMVPVRFDLQ
jgi:protein TonB